MLLSPVAVGNVSEILDASDFYRESHGKIFLAALGALGEGRAGRRHHDRRTSSTSAASSSRSEGRRASPSSPLSSRARRTSSTTRESSRRWRRCAGSSARARRSRGSARTVPARYRISSIGPSRWCSSSASSGSRVTSPHRSSAQGELRADHAAVRGGVEITGAPRGFRELDLLTSGFQPGNFVILAARPSMGKSSLAMCIGANLGVRNGVPVALFTLEMSSPR